MTNLSALLTAASALAEAVQFLGDLLLLLLSLSALSRLTESAYRLAQFLRWLADLLLLLVALVLSIVGTVAPVIGRAAGAVCGRVYRVGRQARRWYAGHAQTLVAQLLTAADYQTRQAIAQQLGSGFPRLTAAVAPAVLLSLRIAPDATQSACLFDLTIRQLKAMARAAGVPRYSRLNKPALVEAIAAA